MRSVTKSRSRLMSALKAGCSAALVSLASACGGTDTTTATTSGAAKDAGSTGGATNGSGGTSSGVGGTSSGVGGASSGAGGMSGAAQGGRGNAGTSGRPGAGGTTDCPPECFVNNRCVEACGDTPRDFGCCPCPAGTINVFSCPADDGGSGSGGASGGRTSCDTKKALCPALPPSCPTGQVPSVDGSCFGPCVPIASCSCTQASDCPDPNQYTCHLSRGVCDYYVN